jgi:hypothetical protein
MIGQYVQAESTTGRSITGILRETNSSYHIIFADGGSIFYLPVQNVKSMVAATRKKISAVADPWNEPVLI